MSISFLFGRGIRTSPVTKIADFEWVPITLLLALLVIRILRILKTYEKRQATEVTCLFWQRYENLPYGRTSAALRLLKDSLLYC